MAKQKKKQKKKSVIEALEIILPSVTARSVFVSVFVLSDGYSVVEEQ